MIDVSRIPTYNAREEFEKSIANYRKAGIEFEELEHDDSTGFLSKVKVTQKRLVNGYILNQKQLIERAKDVYKAPNLKIIPVVYSLDVSEINPKWIEDKMQEFGIRRSDLIKQLAIDKSSLSLYLSGNRKMDKSQKAAFYFYFLTYELNRDVREYINQ